MAEKVIQNTEGNSNNYKKNCACPYDDLALVRVTNWLNVALLVKKALRDERIRTVTLSVYFRFEVDTASYHKLS